MSYELSNCIRSNDGSLYCYDCQTKRMVKLIVEPIDVTQLPADVIDTLIQRAVQEK